MGLDIVLKAFKERMGLTYAGQCPDDGRLKWMIKGFIIGWIEAKANWSRFELLGLKEIEDILCDREYDLGAWRWGEYTPLVTETICRFCHQTWGNPHMPSCPVKGE